MKSIKDNRIVVDLNKVSWSKFGYRNQFGNWRDTIPKQYTSRGEEFDAEATAFDIVTSGQINMLGRAILLKVLDHWQPELHLKVQANAYLIYTGNKAVELNKAWKAKIFKKEK